MSKNITITLAISIIADQLESFIANFSFKSVIALNEIILIIQGKYEDKYLENLDEKIIVVNDKGLGISRSRNIAIKHSSSNYIWFMDCDVFIDFNAVEIVENYINNIKADIFTIRTKYKETGKPYKKYSRQINFYKFKIINISSIEIIASLDFIKNNNLKFNESLGIGSKFPSSEENIFLLDAYYNKAIFSHVPEYIQSHPYIDRKLSFKKPEVLYAKGIFCNRFSGLSGILLMMFWYIKALRHGSSIYNATYLIKGYLNANNYLVK